MNCVAFFMFYLLTGLKLHNKGSVSNFHCRNTRICYNAQCYFKGTCVSALRSDFCNNESSSCF